MTRGDADAGDDQRIVAIETTEHGGVRFGVAGRELQARQRFPGDAHRLGEHAAEPRDDRLGRRREFGRQVVRRMTGAAEEQVEHLKHEAAVEHRQRGAVARRDLERQPGGQRVCALRAVIGEALHDERFGKGTHLLAQQRLEHAAQ